jgi:hypothetical protein
MENYIRIRQSFFAATMFALALVLFVPKSASAAVSPLSIGIVPPIQFPPSEYTVTGARLSVLWGHHRDLYGLDLGGLGNITDQDFHGLALSGIFNITKGTTTIVGLQAAGLVNANIQKSHIVGLQLAALVNYNEAESMVAGIQLAAANIAKFTDVYGAQFGLYNQARSVYGIQIGVVNVATSLHGIQIGLMNFNTTGLFYVAPILNVGF